VLFMGFADFAELRRPYNSKLVMSRLAVRVPSSALIFLIDKPNTQKERSPRCIVRSFLTSLWRHLAGTVTADVL